MAARLSPRSLKRAPEIVMVALSVVVMGPMLLGRGFSLVGDMVFVPTQPWKDAWLGAEGRVPRAVPSDAVVSLATNVVPGDLVQKAVLVAILLGSGWGVLRLLPRAPAVARTTAATLYLWNPFVYERLAIGHWALLVGYAVLPWVVRLAAEAAHGRRRSWWGLMWALGVAAAASPSGGLLALGTAMAVATFGRAGPGGLSRVRLLTLTLLGGGLLNLPWVLPGLLNAEGSWSAVTGVSAFAARADTDLGVLGSILSFGGLWKSSVAAPGREVPLLAILALLLSSAGLVGLVLDRRGKKQVPAGLLLAAGVGLLLAWLPATSFGLSATESLVARVPGTGILRDSQKWLPPFVLAVACGTAVLLSAVLSRFGSRVRQLPVWLAGVAALPVVLLPGLAWGELGRIEPVEYPASWSQMRDSMKELGAAEERSVVLPFSLYRRFGWNGDRAGLDPAPRFFPGDVVTDDTLDVGSVVVPGEDPEAALVSAAAAEGPAALGRVLTERGIRWVLVEIDTPGEVTEPGALGAEVVVAEADLELWDLGPDVTAGRLGGGDAGERRWPYYLGSIAAFLFWVLAGVVWCYRCARPTLLRSPRIFPTRPRGVT